MAFFRVVDALELVEEAVAEGVKEETAVAALVVVDPSVETHFWGLMGQEMDEEEDGVEWGGGG